jgi:hypothetical protein
MKAVLSQLEKEPVGILHLRRSTPAYVRVIEYDQLPKKGSIEQVFGKHKAVIILYTMHSEGKQVDGTGHYACLTKEGKHVMYFSSYGLAPGAEIAATHSDPSRLRLLLGKNAIVSKSRMQSKYHTATCGRWAYARAVLADLPLKSFVQFFGGRLHLKTADEIVSLATIFAIR